MAIISEHWDLGVQEHMGFILGNGVFAHAETSARRDVDARQI